MQQFTRQQVEQGVSPGFDDFFGPTFSSQDVIDAVASDGQVTMGMT